MMSSSVRRATIAALAVLIATAISFLLPSDCPEKGRRMFFIFILAAFFWALEIIPLHATSLLVIVLQIFLLQSPYETFLISFSNPVIFLFFGGFTLAAAMNKHHLDKELAERLMSIFGNNPFWVMTGFMIITAFFAFWMSATATTAMMLILIQPLLSQIKQGNPFRKALVLAIPFGARIGGLCTPVGTPPNAIAVGILEKQGFHLGFLSWMAMGVPLALIMLVISSIILYVMFKPNDTTMRFVLDKGNPIEKTGVAVFIIGMLTIVLWLTSGVHKVPEAVISLVSATLFFGFNLLDRDDMKRIDWDILILMWGGLALGTGMEISGLADWIIGIPLFSQGGFTLLAAFCLFAMLISTFMSNTAAANLLVPLVISIPGESPVLLAVAVALSCSFDIPLPISSPPNALAFSTKVISVKDLLKAGIPVTAVAIALIILGARFVMTPIFKISY